MTVPGKALLHPATLAALALWALNDHVFKASGYLPWVTGKLSDVVSLIAFPLIATAAFEWLVSVSGRRVRSTAVLRAACLATAIVMVSINLNAACADLYEVGLGAVQWAVRIPFYLVQSEALPALHRVKLWMDPTDVWTVPAALIPLWIHARSQDPVPETAAGPNAANWRSGRADSRQ